MRALSVARQETKGTQARQPRRHPAVRALQAALQAASRPSLAKHMRFASTNPSGCSAAVAHVLWEHEVVGSNPTTPTTIPPSGTSGSTAMRRRWAARAHRGARAVRIVSGSRREPAAAGVARTATNRPRGSSQAPCSLALLQVPQRKPAARSARRPTGPICCRVRNVDTGARPRLFGRPGRVTIASITYSWSSATPRRST